MAAAYRTNIESDTLKNKYYRKVEYTDKNMQLVLMRLLPREEIGVEAHENITQFFRIERGQGKAIIGKKKYVLEHGVVVIVPPNTLHNIINTSATDDLLLYTIYSPPAHAPGKKQIKKQTPDRAA